MPDDDKRWVDRIPDWVLVAGIIISTIAVVYIFYFAAGNNPNP